MVSSQDCTASSMPGFQNLSCSTYGKTSPSEDSRSGSESSGEQDNLNVWRNLEDGGLSAHFITPPPQLELRKGGVWARAIVPAGTRFGPFLGKWVPEPRNEDYAWEVLVPSAGMRGFLDASEFGTWLKFIRRDKSKQNLKHILLAGQIFYESLRTIQPDEELCLGGRDPIQLDGGDGGQGSGGLAAGDEDKLAGKDDDRIDEEESVDIEDNGVKCLVCDKLYPDVYILDKHMIETHRYEPDKYICEHCNKGFAWRPNLLRHKMIHGEFRRFPCENCDKVFTDPSNLQRHIRTSHVGARCHACPECGKTFATSSGLKQHTHIHSSVKPFRCEVCFKSYTQFSNLCRHKRMHANCRMQIKCHKCGQAFSTVTSLSKHRRFCDSSPVPFHLGHHKLSHMDHPVGSESMGPSNGHFPSPPLNLNNKFLPGPPYFPSPFSSHLHSLLGPNGPGAPGFPFLQNPNMMFPSMLTRMALNQLNGKSLLPPLPPASSPDRLLKEDIKPSMRPTPSPENSFLTAAKLDNVKTNISDFKSIEEFRQRLINGSLNRNTEINERQVVNNDAQNSQQKVEIKQEVEDNNTQPQQEINQGFDVNRNKSDSDTPSSGLNKEGGQLAGGEGENKNKKGKERPLDLSNSRRDECLDNGSQSDTEMDSIQCSKVQPDQGNISTIEYSEKVEFPRDREGKEEEPRGFKPVFPSNKSFKPLSQSSPFPSPRHSSEEPNPPPVSTPTSTFSKLQGLGAPGMGSDSNLPFPKPVNPFLLGAMYRMQQPPYSPFPPSLSPAGALPHIAPRPPLPFSSPFMSGLHNPAFLPNPSAFPLLGRLSCYQDVLNGSQSKTKDRYSCKFCGKIFPRSANLTRHLRTHTGEQPYKCKYCERSFSISSNLQRHVRNIHNKEKPFKCPLCERCFGQQTNLERHIKKHETCSDPSEIVDSPESVRMEDDLGYFDEIRSFMGKVVDKNSSIEASDTEDIDVEEDEDEEDEEDIIPQHLRE